MLKIYNTERRRKEVIAPREETGKLLIYTCGPTVYDYAHIGNFRTYVFEDILRRTIKYFGFPIRQVMNLTDVDDKTIKGAIHRGISLTEYTQIYKEAFFSDLKVLNIEPVEEYVSATDTIPEITQMIAVLLKKKLAYQSDDGSVYFNIDRFPSYGRLSHLKINKFAKNASPSGTLEDEYTQDSVSNFALWKAYDLRRDGDVYWESPFGRGRPGWHIECSAMAIKLLGETIDIHVGGVDNIFPHHENEIAQSEGYTGKTFVRYWIHVGHLIVDGRKMSKSFGNFYTLRDLIKKGYSGIELRYLLLKTHYRTQLNFTLEELEASRQALLRWRGCVERLRAIEGGSGGSLSAHVYQARTTFKKALGDDLNISMGLAAIFDLIKIVNTEIDSHNLSRNGAQEVLNLFEEVDVVLGVLPTEEGMNSIPRDIQEAFAKREAARTDKNWQEADKQREYIQMRGYTVEDDATKSTVKKQR